MYDYVPKSYDVEEDSDDHGHSHKEYRVADEIQQYEIHEPNLTMLITMQGILKVGSGSSRLRELLKLQGCLDLFYMTFLELDFTNMSCLLSSNSACIVQLLWNVDHPIFHSKTPLIQRLRIQYIKDNFVYMTPIDLAIEAN